MIKKELKQGDCGLGGAATLMTKLRTFALLLGGLALLSAGTMVYQNHRQPQLGVSEGKLQPLAEKPNGVSTQALDPAKRVDVLPFREDLESTKAALKSALSAYGSFSVESEGADYLRVLFVTPTMRYRDDAEFWLDEEDKVVHFRSQSRVGYSDMGLNRVRYEKLRELYESL